MRNLKPRTCFRSNFGGNASGIHVVMAPRALYRRNQPWKSFQARRMQEPTDLDEVAVKHMARFLEARLRTIWLFPWQKQDTCIDTWCDTDPIGPERMCPKGI